MASDAPASAPATDAPDALYDVAIVGAGLAGLACAEEILRARPGARVLVLEARDRVGGRTLTTRLGDGSDARRVVDEGGMWIGNLHTEMLALCERYGVTTFPQLVDARARDVYVTPERERWTFRGDVPPVSLLAKLDLARFVLAVNRLAADLDLDRPWEHPLARELDAESVASFVAKRAWSRQTAWVINDVAKSWGGCEAASVSMLWFIVAIKSAGGLEFALSTKSGAQEWRLRGGAQQIAIALARDVVAAGARLELDATVVGARLEIARDGAGAGAESGARVAVLAIRRADGTVHERRARTLVCAANISTFLRTAHFSPPLPHNVAQFANRVFPGSYGKAVFVYRNAWWRDAGFSGTFLASHPDAVLSSGYDMCSAEDGVTRGSSGPDVCALVGFFAGDAGVAAASLSPSERKERALRDVEIVFGEELAPRVRDGLVEYHEKIWNLDPVARGCSSVIMPPGTCVPLSAARVFPRGRPVPWGAAEGDESEDGAGLGGGVWFAGTDVAREFLGYMEGAVRDGRGVGRAVCLRGW